VEWVEPTFANVPAATGCECWNQTTSQAGIRASLAGLRRGAKNRTSRRGLGRKSQCESRFFEAVEMTSGGLEKLSKNPILSIAY
jgi:hypothetical protein